MAIIKVEYLISARKREVGVLMKIAVGIISYFPADKNVRENRKEGLRRLLKQLVQYFPDQDVLVCAQCWTLDEELEMQSIHPKLFIFNHEKGLGIPMCRIELRDIFLNQTNYDYMLMFDDDAEINTTFDKAQHYLRMMEEHPEGFSVLQGHFKDPLGHYDPAQLNGAAFSRFILEQENWDKNWNAQNPATGVFDDVMYVYTCHYKYPQYEFIVNGISCTQWSKPQRKSISTWLDSKLGRIIYNNTKQKLNELKQKYRK